MGEVQRRDLYFFPGYDIEGVKRYHRYLQRQAVLYKRRFDVKIAVSALRDTENERWQVADVRAEWPEGPVHTRYHFCDWTDDIARDYARPVLIRQFRMLRGLARVALRGQLFRVFRKAPYAATLLMQPFLLLLARLCVAALALWVASYGLLPALAAGIVSYTLFALLRRAGEKGYEIFFESHIAYLDRSLRHGAAPAGDKLNDAILALEDMPATDVDEVMIAGHSIGGLAAVLAAEICGRKGQPVSVLTAGSILPLFALDPKATRLHQAITALYERDGVCWRDYFAPQDIMCFRNIQPIRDYRLSPVRPLKGDISTRTAIFDEVFSPRKIQKFRWNLLRMHFQIIMAADNQGGYDWIRHTLGPDRLVRAPR